MNLFYIKKNIIYLLTMIDWVISKIKKENQSWNEAFINMIKEEDETLSDCLIKKGLKFVRRTYLSPRTFLGPYFIIMEDIDDIAASVYKCEKTGVAIGIFTLASDICTYGTAGGLTRAALLELVNA